MDELTPARRDGAPAAAPAHADRATSDLAMLTRSRALAARLRGGGGGGEDGAGKAPPACSADAATRQQHTVRACVCACV